MEFVLLRVGMEGWLTPRRDACGDGCMDRCGDECGAGMQLANCGVLYMSGLVSPPDRTCSGSPTLTHLHPHTFALTHLRPPSPTFTTLTHPTSTPTRPLCLTHWPCESPDHSSSHSPISPPPADATGHYVSCLVVPLSHTHKQSTRGVGGPVVGTSVGRAKRASQIHTLAISRWASQSMGRSVIHGHLNTRTTRSYIGTSAH